MARQAITFTVHIDGVRTTLRAFRELPADASKRLREESLKLAEVLAQKARADGMADAAPQSKLVATTVKATRDRVPAIQAGGTKRLGRHRAPAFGLPGASGRSTPRLRRPPVPHLGRSSVPRTRRPQRVLVLPGRRKELGRDRAGLEQGSRGHRERLRPGRVISWLTEPAP